MKNEIIFIVFIVLSIFALVLLTGCGKDENVTETEIENVAGNENGTETESKKADLKDLVGTYQLIELTTGGFVITEEDLKDNNIVTTLEVKEDKTAILHEAEGDTECGYDETEFTYIVSGVVTHAKWAYNGEKLWLIMDANNELVFKKIK